MFTLGVRLWRAIALLAIATALSATPGWGADPTQRCQVKKLRAAEKHAACVGRAKRRAVLGQTTDTAACTTAFRTARDAAGDCRFLDNGNQTVTDLDTGLTWERKVEGTGCLHCVEPLDWTTAMSTWISEVNGLANDEGPPHEAGLGGHSDWRLPNEIELNSLRDPTAPLCAVEQSCLSPDIGPSVPTYHWSSITDIGDSSQALVVTFRSGSFVGDFFSRPKAESNAVRAVRGSFITGAN